MTHIIYTIAFLISLTGCYLLKRHARCGYQTIVVGNLFRISYRKHEISECILIAAPPIMLLALRYGIGGDYYNYKMFYEQYINTGFSQFEPLAEVLMFINEKLFGNYQSFLAMIASCTFVLIVIWCVKFSKTDSCFLTIGIIYCFYFGYAMNTIFQVLAASIILYSFYFVEQRKFFKFLISVIIAALIHSSALVVLPLYFVVSRAENKSGKNNNGKPILKIVGIALLSSLAIYVFVKYGAYYGFSYSGYIGRYSEGGLINVYLKLGILFYIPELYFMPYLLKKNKRYELYYILIIMEALCFYMSLSVAYAFRMAYYFSFAHAIIIPGIVRECAQNKEKNLVRIYFILILLFWFIFTTYICKYNGFYEYKSILQLK